ncbi:lipoprotein 17-related variable surface protein [Mycoplasma seminis]|uniref:Lipoprotein 17-related variable surface protein n=1 Tax=Mycoplasma seminis TaxID=512749 RepID=A0ABY9HBD0_9MOLU|nr:lipoprotein 17-related variable surface protein [Mycoplasma seminis]WLP85499.1 lipoprotein 17-related variable surface protein [Mycoplasma seminis]
MKKSMFLVISTASAVVSTPLLLASCESTTQKLVKQPKTNKQQVLKQKTLNELFTEGLNSVHFDLQDNDLLKLYPSEIKYQNLKITKNSSSDIIFQFSGDLIPDDVNGNLKINFYFTAKDPKTSKWIKSEVKSLSLSGFKNLKTVAQEQLNKLTYNFEDQNNTSLLPNAIVNRNKVTFSPLESDRLHVVSQFDADDENGNVTLSYKLRSFNPSYETQSISKTFSGFKTTLQDQREKELVKMNQISASLNNISLKSSIIKKQTRPRNITLEDFNLPQNESYKLSLNSITPNDDKGSLDVSFKVISNKFNDIVSNDKTITLTGLLTTEEYNKQSDASFLKTLNESFASFIYSGLAKNTTLASETLDNQYSAENNKNKVTIVSLDKSDILGRTLITYTMNATNSETNSELTSEAKTFEIDGFITQGSIQEQLDEKLSLLSSLELSSIDKPNTQASHVTKQNIVSLSDNNFDFIINSLEANDQDGSLQVSVKFVSKKNWQLHSNDKTITIDGFLTNAEIIRRSDAAFLNELNSKQVSFNFTGENKDNTLPTNATEKEKYASSIQPDVNVEILRLIPNNDLGQITIKYSLNAVNPESKNTITVSEPKEVTLSGFLTTEAHNIQQENIRLNSLLQNVTVDLNPKFNKSQNKASKLNSMDLISANLAANSNAVLKFNIIGDDENGVATIEYYLVSNSEKLVLSHSDKKIINISGFYTREQERLNKLIDSINTFDSKDISLEPSVFNKETFMGYYQDNKYAREVTKPDKLDNFINLSIENTKIIIESIKIQEDLINNDLFNLEIKFHLNSLKYNNTVSKSKTVVVNGIDLIAQKYLENYYLPKLQSLKFKSGYVVNPKICTFIQ